MKEDHLDEKGNYTSFHTGVSFLETVNYSSLLKEDILDRILLGTSSKVVVNKVEVESFIVDHIVENEGTVRIQVS